MSEPIYLTKLEIRNLGKIEYLVSELGLCNLICGANESGKTSVARGLSLIFSAGNDTKLLKLGTEEGWAQVWFSDGYTAKKRLFTKKDGTVGYELTVLTPSGGTKEEPVAFLIDRMPRQSFHVDDFLSKDVDDQVEFMLKLMPLEFSPEEINTALSCKPPAPQIVSGRRLEGETWEQANERARSAFKAENREEFKELPKVSESLDLKKFDDLFEQITTQRARLNKLLKNLEGAKAVLEKGLTNKDERDWGGDRDFLQGQISSIDEQIRAVKLELENEGLKLKQEKLRQVNERKAELKRQIEELNHQIHEADADILGYSARVDQKTSEMLKDGTAALEESRSSLSLKLGEARTQAENQQKELGRREAVQKYMEQISVTNIHESDLTQALQALDQLRMSKLSQTDVPGLNIRFEKKRPIITVFDVPFERVNAQGRIVMAIRCLKKANPKCPFFLIESAELDRDHLFMVAEALRDIGAQLIAPRWIEGEPLEILDEDGYKAKLLEKARELVEEAK